MGIAIPRDLSTLMGTLLLGHNLLLAQILILSALMKGLVERFQDLEGI